MNKLFTILSCLTIGMLLVHVPYMVLGVTHVITMDEALARNMSFKLMDLAFIHGAWGLYKWIRVLICRRKCGGSTVKLNATKVTFIQRISGVIIMALAISHEHIKFLHINLVTFMINAVFILLVLFHLYIGIPKILVSLGLLNDKRERKLKDYYGGGK